jgi:cell division inhibitor SulA
MTLHQPDKAGLDVLLQHPALWRGRGAAPREGFATGFNALDAALPDAGWPRRGLVEILVPAHGCGELALWTPLIRRLTHSETARWCAFVAPPFEPFAPAWQQQGARLDRLLVVQGRPAESLWALERCLLSGACALAIAWPQTAGMTELRRLALAAERGNALGVLIRPARAARESSAATLRIALTRTAAHLRCDLLKGRGLVPRVVEVALP